ILFNATLCLRQYLSDGQGIEVGLEEGGYIRSTFLICDNHRAACRIDPDHDDVRLSFQPCLQGVGKTSVSCRRHIKAHSAGYPVSSFTKDSQLLCTSPARSEPGKRLIQVIPSRH